MHIKTVLTAFFLTLLPAWAAAQGCSFGDHSQEVTMSCAVGTVYDAASDTCVPTASS